MACPRSVPFIASELKEPAQARTNNAHGISLKLFDTPEASDVQAELMSCIDKRAHDIKPNSVQVGMA